MNHRIACLMIAGLALSAGPQVGMSASSVHDPAAEVDILVNGAPLRRYAHGGRWYVEALKGREYSIRLRNPYPVRVAVALSVDGLNTIDARHTTAAEARKWVLEPHQTVTISGWQTSRTEARRFEFTTEPQSYAQALGKPANLGTISAVFFRERARMVSETPNEYAGRRSDEPRAAAPARQDANAAANDVRKDDGEHAATGMGRRTGHAVVRVSLDLEDTPVQTMNVRYEFRPQLVRLGVVPPTYTADPLQRRERAHGFDPGFSPEPPRR